MTSQTAETSSSSIYAQGLTGKVVHLPLLSTAKAWAHSPDTGYVYAEGSKTGCRLYLMNEEEENGNQHYFKARFTTQHSTKTTVDGGQTDGHQLLSLIGPVAEEDDDVIDYKTAFDYLMGQNALTGAEANFMKNMSDLIAHVLIPCLCEVGHVTVRVTKKALTVICAKKGGLQPAKIRFALEDVDRVTRGAGNEPTMRLSVSSDNWRHDAVENAPYLTHYQARFACEDAELGHDHNIVNGDIELFLPTVKLVNSEVAFWSYDEVAQTQFPHAVTEAEDTVNHLLARACLVMSEAPESWANPGSVSLFAKD